ncbi:hypothetical protein BH24BAC1_BH24BAC1_11290 [soil metagenome]
MKSFLSVLLSFLLLWSVFSCQPKDEILTTDPKAVLRFSSDTVLFDTVFVARGTVTKRLLVYNPNARAVRIDQIRLGRGGSSPFRLTVDGVESPLVSGIQLRGRDSLHILVKAYINPADTNAPFLVTDSITFLTNSQPQDVKLVAYGQNVYLHHQELVGTSVWKADKPHIVSNIVRVMPGATLTVEAGARIHTLPRSFIQIDGTLRVQGTAEKRVLFTGHRLERRYENVPGQWNGIHFRPTSRSNVIRYAEIKNAIVGLWADYSAGRSPVEVRVENTIIRNMYRSGILSWAGNVRATNTLIANCGDNAVVGLGGGTYEFIHCTIANYYTEAVRKSPAFAFDTEWERHEAPNVVGPLSVKVQNSIIWGNQTDGEEILILEEGKRTLQTVQLTFEHNILRTGLYKELLSTSTDQIRQNKLSEDARFPRFKSTQQADFRLDKTSPAIEAALPLPGLRTDLEGKPRKELKPDIGAYEWREE